MNYIPTINLAISLLLVPLMVLMPLPDCSYSDFNPSSPDEKSSELCQGVYSGIVIGLAAAILVFYELFQADAYQLQTVALFDGALIPRPVHYLFEITRFEILSSWNALLLSSLFGYLIAVWPQNPALFSLHLVNVFAGLCIILGNFVTSLHLINWPILLLGMYVLCLSIPAFYIVRTASPAQTQAFLSSIFWTAVSFFLIICAFAYAAASDLVSIWLILGYCSIGAWTLGIFAAVSAY